MTNVLDVLSRSTVHDTDITAFTVVPATPQPIPVKITTTPVFRTGAGTDALRAPRALLATRREYRIERPETSVHPGTAALHDLRSWLGLPLDTLVACVGLSPSVRQFWRQHPNAPVRRGKAGRLLRLHTAVGLLVAAVGAEDARTTVRADGWLDEPLDETRLGQFEARIRGIVRPGGLSMPVHLAGGLTPELLAQVADPVEDLSQQDRERTSRTDSFGPEEPA
ncbi:MAG: hypothetical protein M3P93_01015 [Actinomycetota bacterium]|nr:hypothetical protein [Actinomycetota bacterium]